MRRPAPSPPAIDGKSTADDLVRLVLALIETLRQLIERQAIRRVEGGHLTEDDNRAPGTGVAAAGAAYGRTQGPFWSAG